MKTITTIAAMLLSTAAHAGGLGAPIAEAPMTSSTFIDDTERYAYCTNAPITSGGGNGLMLEGIGWIYEAAYADRATAEVAGVLPAGLSAHDAQDVVNGLAAIGYTNVILFTRPDRDDKIVTGTETVIDAVVETVVETSTKPRGVSDGSVHSAPNLTSMGNNEDGTHTFRVRAETDQNVTIRRAGGDSFTVAVQAGDTLIDVPTGGTYIATFGATHRNITKASGPQLFDDTITTSREIVTEVPREVEVDMVVRTSSPERWCRGPRR
jgi:hypothetical protein